MDVVHDLGRRGWGVSLGLAKTIYIRCIYGIFGREITKYTVIYGVYIRFWPTLRMTEQRKGGRGRVGRACRVVDLCIAGESKSRIA